MRDLFAFSTANKFASPEQGAAVQPLREIGVGYFSARYFAVTAFVWFGVFAVAGSLWYTAFALGAVVAGYFR